MSSGRPLIQKLLLCNHCAKRKPTTQRLCGADNIRDYPIVFKRPKCSGTPKACLNLVNHHKRGIFVAKISDILQKSWWRDIDSAVPLNWLHKNGCDILRNQEPRLNQPRMVNIKTPTVQRCYVSKSPVLHRNVETKS